MKKLLLLSLIAMLALGFWACSSGDDDDDAAADDDATGDDDTGGGDDDTSVDDDATGDDDTGADDDATGDDDTAGGDDDTAGGEHAPVLSGGLWDPNPCVVDPTYDILYSDFFFNICDTGDDLSGGLIYGYHSGTDQPFWDGGTMDLDTVASNYGTSLSPADDCDNPIELAFGINFTGAPADDYCLDLEATDAAGYLSNKLVNFCVTVE